MSTFLMADPYFHPLMLSSRLISELARAHSTLRATTERFGSAVIVNAGGELDASNEATWRRLLSEASAAAGPPGPRVVARIVRACGLTDLLPVDISVDAALSACAFAD